MQSTPCHRPGAEAAAGVVVLHDRSLWRPKYDTLPAMAHSSNRAKTVLTTMVSVTTMEEMPLLAETERADLLASLQEAEAGIKAGRCVEHDSGAFVDRLMAIRNTAKQSSSA